MKPSTSELVFNLSSLSVWGSVLFVLLVTLVDLPAPFPQVLQSPRVGVALLVLVVCVAVWAAPQWLRWIYLVAYGGGLLSLLFEIPHLLVSDGVGPGEEKCEDHQGFAKDVPQHRKLLAKAWVYAISAQTGI